jgi:DNA-binding MarR family transcriptional regulator
MAEPSTDSLLALLLATARFMRSVESVRHQLAEDQSLGDTHFRALTRIAEGGEQTPKALAASLDMTNGAITTVTDRLVLLGLLERRPHPHDRRSILLSLTDAGQAGMQRVFDLYDRAIGDATRGASEESVNQLVEYLGRLSDGLASGSTT